MMDKEKRMFANRKKVMKRHPKRSQLKGLQREIQKRLRQEYWKYVEDIMTPSEVIPEDMFRQLYIGKADDSYAAAPKPPGGHPINPSPDDKKKLYQHLKHAKQDSIGVAPIRNPTTSELETESQKKAQLLNSQFFSVFSVVYPVSRIKSCKRLLGIGQSTPVMPEFRISEKQGWVQVRDGKYKYKYSVAEKFDGKYKYKYKYRRKFDGKYKYKYKYHGKIDGKYNPSTSTTAKLMASTIQVQVPQQN